MKMISKYRSMSAEELLQYEAAVHDEGYAFDRASFRPPRIDLNGFWTTHDRPWKRHAYIRGWKMRRAFELMGDVTGKRILDVGCGTGAHAATLAVMGAEVWGFDLSRVAIEKARLIADANGVGHRCHFEVGNAAEMPYEAEYFDIVFCGQVLHHIWKYPNVDGELYRVLKPGGRLVFAEGIRSNPVYNAARNLKRWLRGEEPKGDIDWEYEDVMEFASRFTEAHVEFYYLTLSMKDVVGRSRDQVAPVRALFYVLDHLDEWLLSTFPRLHKYAKETSGCLIK